MANAELFEPILTTDALLMATDGAAFVRAMLTFEAELALAQADVGLVPAHVAEEIARAAGALHADVAALGRAARAAGNPVVPLVAELRRSLGQEAVDFVHYGATSQDALDTAMMLVVRNASGLINGSLGLAEVACARLAEAHSATLLAGRTLLQQALPVPLALKVAGWLVGLVEADERLDEFLAKRLAVQLGGAAGTLAVLGARGPAVVLRLAERLSLQAPPLAWHTDRTRIAELAAALGLVAGAAAKVALDIAMMSQTELGEVLEPAVPGRGSSSTLPHKRNPIGTVLTLGAARRAHGLLAVLFSAMVQEHERAAGAWHAEWLTLAELLRAAGGAAANVAEVLDGLEVHPEQMASNLSRLGGVLLAERVVFDLAPALGRTHANELVETAARRALETRASFASVLGANEEVRAHRTEEEIRELCEPAGYLGASATFVAQALARYRTSLDRKAEPS